MNNQSLNIQIDGDEILDMFRNNPLEARRMVREDYRFSPDTSKAVIELLETGRLRPTNEDLEAATEEGWNNAMEERRGDFEDELDFQIRHYLRDYLKESWDGIDFTKPKDEIIKQLVGLFKDFIDRH